MRRKSPEHPSEAIYGFLVDHLYPKAYRQEFGEEMKYVFSETLASAQAQRGAAGVVRLWLNTVADIAASATRELADNHKGGNFMKQHAHDIIMQNRVFGWIAAGTASVLLAALIAMQFSDGMAWELFDFIVLGVLLFGTSSAFVLAARKIRTPRHRLLLAGICALAIMFLWAELAVGIFTNWGS